jgi:hypothetical protein
MTTVNQISTGDAKAISDIVLRLSGDNIDCADVSDLFLRLRSYLNDKDPVKEVANFLAHSERDRGVTFDRTEAYITNSIDVMTKQFGSMTWNSVMLWSELFSSLEMQLRAMCANNFAINDNSRAKLKQCILRLLQNRSLSMRDGRITRCDLIVHAEEVFVEFQLSGVRNVSSGMRWRVPYFGAT